MVPRPAPWSSSSSYLVESVCSPSAKRCQRPASAVRGRLNIVLTNFLSAASFRPRQQGDGHGLEQLVGQRHCTGIGRRSEEHTSELQSLMRISYAVFCLKKKKQTPQKHTT